MIHLSHSKKPTTPGELTLWTDFPHLDTYDFTLHAQGALIAVLEGGMQSGEDSVMIRASGTTSDGKTCCVLIEMSLKEFTLAGAMLQAMSKAAKEGANVPNQMLN